jgi:DNA-binding PadR family transcriptional regulator
MPALISRIGWRADNRLQRLHLKADAAAKGSFPMISGRYWLLDSAAETGVPLGFLDSPNLEEALNRPHHGCTTEEIAHSIAAMIEQGELRIRSRRPSGSRPEWEFLSEDRILERIGEPRHNRGASWYELTERGGAMWEEWARPDWTRYNTSCIAIRDRPSVHFSALLAAVEATAQALFELEPYLQDGREIVASSVRRKVLRDWRATYWKSLPEGHVVAFRSTERSGRSRRATPQWAWDRWCALRHWYERPVL